MNTDGTLWQEGDTWTNERGVTFRLERHATPGGPVYIWAKQHYQIPEDQVLELAAL